MAKGWSVGEETRLAALSDAGPRPKASERGGVAFKSLAWIFVLSRLFFIEAASLAYIYLPQAWVQAPQGTLPPSGSALYQILSGLWVHWDGLWYLSIATLGYHGRPTATAFFPLYPLSMKLFGSGVVGGMTVSLLAFAVALYYLNRLVSLELGPRVAWYTLLALAFFPTAFYLNAVYSEALFMALAAGSLYYLRTERYWIAGPLGALATLTTTYGILLVLPFFWVIYRREGWRLGKLLHVIWMPLGLLAYMVFLFKRFGDPLMFESAQSNWSRHFEIFPVTWYNGVVAAWRAMPQFFSFHHLFATGNPSLVPGNFFNLIFAIFAVLVVVLTARRLPFYLWIYTVAALLIPFSYPAVGYPLMSMPRLILEAFPIFIGLGMIMARVAWTRALYFVLAIPMGLLFTALFATAHWVA